MDDPVEAMVMERLDIFMTTQGGCQVVDVPGEIDLATADQLDQALTLSRIPGRPLVADLADVGFCDASGLRTLLVANAQGGQWRAPLQIVPSRPVSLVIGLAQADGTLTLFSDRSHALVANLRSV